MVSPLVDGALGACIETTRDGAGNRHPGTAAPKGPAPAAMAARTTIRVSFLRRKLAAMMLPRSDTSEPSMVQSTRHSSSWPVGRGEMAECIRRHDWATTALGPIAGWPPHLRTALDICLASPLPIAILWGEQRLQLYNDAYRAIAQQR